MTHTHEHSQAGSGGRLFATIVVNVVITAAEFIGGFLSGYLALVADAFHNLSDVASLLLAYFGEISSRKPATKQSTYGFKRIEVMTAFISAVALVVIAVYIFYEAYDRIINPLEISKPVLILVIAGIGLAGNILSVWLLHPSKDKTLNIKAAFLHMLYDAISSVAVIIGAVFILKTGWTIIDPILAIIIGLMILWSSFDVLKEATMIFMEAVPKRLNIDEVYDEIIKHPVIQDAHHLHVWSLSSTSVAMSCHICIDPGEYDKSPQVIRDLNVMLHDKFHIEHSTIQSERRRCPDDHEEWISSEDTE